MSVNLTPVSASLINHAVGWGLASPRNLSLLGLDTVSVSSLQHSAFHRQPINPKQALTGFALVFGASGSSLFSASATQSTLVQLTSSATPARVREYMRGLGHYYHFKNRFERTMSSVEAVLEAQLASGANLVGASVAQASWGPAQEALNPRPFGKGGASIRPVEKGPGVRAGRYQRAAARRVTNLFCGPDKRRLTGYSELVESALAGRLAPGEFSERLWDLWDRFEPHLEAGGFLSPDRVAGIDARLDRGETLWDQTVSHLVAT